MVATGRRRTLAWARQPDYRQRDDVSSGLTVMGEKLVLALIVV